MVNFFAYQQKHLAVITHSQHEDGKLKILKWDN